MACQHRLNNISKLLLPLIKHRMPNDDAERHNFDEMLGSAENWTRSGEGAANVVLTYAGVQPDLVCNPPPLGVQAKTRLKPALIWTSYQRVTPLQVGKVLRIRKPNKAVTLPDPVHAHIDQRIWSLHAGLDSPGEQLRSPPQHRQRLNLMSISDAVVGQCRRYGWLWRCTERSHTCRSRAARGCLHQGGARAAYRTSVRHRARAQ